jgi:hypothetical protein
MLACTSAQGVVASEAGRDRWREALQYYSRAIEVAPCYAQVGVARLLCVQESHNVAAQPEVNRGNWGPLHQRLHHCALAKKQL